MPCKDCLSRREFLTRSTLVVVGAAAVAAGCGDGQFGPQAVTPAGGTFSIVVSSVPALGTVGQLVQIGPPAQFVAAKRTGPTSFLALSMVCTHEGCPTFIRSNRFECDCHGSRFDNGGRVTVGPAGTNLPTLTARYDAATDTLTIG